VFRWFCEICGKEVECRAISLNGEYANLVCENGHHQVAYGQMHPCEKCGRDTIHIEILKWRTKPKTQFRIVGLICAECNTKKEHKTQWQDS